MNSLVLTPRSAFKHRGPFRSSRDICISESFCRHRAEHQQFSVQDQHSTASLPAQLTAGRTFLLHGIISHNERVPPATFIGPGLPSQRGDNTRAAPNPRATCVYRAGTVSSQLLFRFVFIQQIKRRHAHIRIRNSGRHGSARQCAVNPTKTDTGHSGGG
jgi:hypothetical protein